MDPHPATPRNAAPLTNYARIERMSEPWSLNRTVAIVVTLALAMIFGTWAASGELENLILVAIWFTATAIIVFVQDYWWSPALILTALTLTTTALGFPLSGMEVGVVILCLTFPVKMAMKTLRKAEPEMSLGVFYWALLGYVAAHAVVILFYNKIEGTFTLKNIVKAYYTVLVPLIFYGLLIRYCHTRTVRPTVVILFFISLFSVTASLFTDLTGLFFDPFTNLKISVAWLDPLGVYNIFRNTAPILFIGSLAFWPAVRPGRDRIILVFAAVVSLLGTLLGSGRLPMATCVAAGIFFAVVRGKLWLALPFIVGTVLISAAITVVPDLNYSLPGDVQRTLAPLNFSQEKTEVQSSLEGSDDWHRDLRTRSIDYWTMDTASFWVGHGYKPWDETILNENDPTENLDTEHLEQLAIEMGRTENMFSSMTNIFGATGLLLYSVFLGNLVWNLYKGRRASPVGSDARALCEFSLINLLAALVFCPFMGGVPGLNLVYWQLGILAARPLLAGGKLAPVSPLMEIPAFARPALSQQTSGRSPHRFRLAGK
jgi:hypothetical protein